MVALTISQLLTVRFLLYYSGKRKVWVRNNVRAEFFLLSSSLQSLHVQYFTIGFVNSLETELIQVVR